MKIFIKIAVILILGGCSCQKPIIDVPITKVQNSSLDQGALPLMWIQQSGEFKALAYQAFNSAKMTFLKSEASQNLKKAVVVDIDETMIDNSPYAAWQIKNNQPFTKESWIQWRKSQKAKALPGAVEFSHFIVENGGEIFYISNNIEDSYNDIENNLKHLGFANITPKNILLIRSDEKEDDNKERRFEEVKKRGYSIVVYVGDNLNDFSGETYNQLNNERRNFTDLNHNKFGNKYVILSNPIYGSWEKGISKKYKSANKKERKEIIENTLEVWNGN